MPRLSVYFVRASLVYLVLGFTFGGLMLANKGILISAILWALLPIHIEFAFVGWMIQLAMGVAFWILPRFRTGAPRGEERWSWAAWMLVNMGIVLIVLSIPFAQQWFALTGRLFEVVGLIAFLLGNWKRIKPFDR